MHDDPPSGRMVRPRCREVSVSRGLAGRGGWGGTGTVGSEPRPNLSQEGKGRCVEGGRVLRLSSRKTTLGHFSPVDCRDPSPACVSLSSSGVSWGVYVSHGEDEQSPHTRADRAENPGNKCDRGDDQCH